MDVVAEWAAWQRAQGLSELTVTARTRRVELLAAMVGDPVTATADDVVAYMASLPRGVSKATRATYYSHLRAWFHWLVTTDRRDDNPTAKLPSPRPAKREPRPVTGDQLAAILDTRMNRRTRMMVYLALFQGLRAHEIAKFRGEDMDPTAGQLAVIGKGGTNKVLPLHPAVVTLAAEAKMPERGWWFPAPEGHEGHIKSRSVSDIVGDVLRRAGVRKGAAHRLRHTFATVMVENGENLRVVQELLRHASLQTTQIYTKVSFDQQRDALRRLLPPDPQDVTP